MGDGLVRGQLEKFSKAELIDYLLAVGYLLQRHPPEYIILEFRLKAIDKEIDENLKRTDALIKDVKAGQISNVKFSERHTKLHAEWHTLREKRKRIEAKLYPKEEGASK